MRSDNVFKGGVFLLNALNGKKEINEITAVWSNIPISKFKIGQEVEINNEIFTYLGQRTVKKSGFKKSVYFFCAGPDKSTQFNVTNPPVFKTNGTTIKKV